MNPTFFADIISKIASLRTALTQMPYFIFYKKLHFFLLLFIFLFLNIQPHAFAQNKTLQEKIVPLLTKSPLDHSTVGISIYDLTADSLLYEYQPSLRLRPASVQKLITAITALDLLGSSHQFKTTLYADTTGHNSSLTQPIYLYGQVDPLFSIKDLSNMVDSIRSWGIDTLFGNIVLDATFKDTIRYGKGWCWDDNNPQLYALKCKEKGDFIHQLRQTLHNKGLVHIGSITFGKTPSNLPIVWEKIHLLDDVLYPMLKKSHNQSAEALFCHLARLKKSHRHTTSDNGCEVVERFLQKNIKGYRWATVADGSGLSLYNYTTAHIIINLLRYAYAHDSIYTHLLRALPIAGIDGTLRTRMKNYPMVNNVHAKTGTLEGVSSLAGYLTDGDGHLLCFVIINQGITNSKEAHKFQDQCCRIMCDFTTQTPLEAEIST